MVYSLGSDRCGSSEGEHFVHAKKMFYPHKRGETCYVKMTLQKESCRCPYLGPLPAGRRGDLQLARLVSTDIDSLTEQSIVILRPSGSRPCCGSDDQRGRRDWCRGQPTTDAMATRQMRCFLQHTETAATSFAVMRRGMCCRSASCFLTKQMRVIRCDHEEEKMCRGPPIACTCWI